LQLARHELEMGKLEEAAWHAQQVIETDPQLAAEAGMFYYWVLSRQGHRAQADEVPRQLAQRFAELREPDEWPVNEVAQAAWFYCTLDPQPQRALMLAEDKETILQHLQKGGFWVIPIMLFALFASITAVCKAVSLFRMPPLFPALAERVAAAIKDNASALDSVMRKVQGPQKELLQIALTPQTAEQRDDRLYAALLEQRNRLERWLGAIAITAAVSPLLGLLGTVSGMITTFKLMTLYGAGDPSSVSAGISEALVTTELGLVVAIPSLLAHALMSRKVKNYFSQLEGDVVNLSQLPVQES